MGVLTRRCAGVCLASLLISGISLGADATAASSLAAQHSEFEVESAMLYNFTKFIEWPDNALGGSGAPVVVGVWNDGLVPVLETALLNRTIYGHPIVVRRLNFSEDAKGCAVLLVGTADRKEIARIVRAVGRSPVLTIGERAQFSRLGGVIAFVRDGNRMRFEINLDAADRAGLQISSKLLRLADVWRENSPQARN